MSTATHDATHGHGHGDANDHAHDHKPYGAMRWIGSTNHKDIGTMYLWFSFSLFLVGGVMALIIRAELFQPGLQIVKPEFFNSMTTTGIPFTNNTMSGRRVLFSPVTLN